MAENLKGYHRQTEQLCSDVDYRPNIPNGTLEMVNKKFAEWEIRRGFRKPGEVKGLRGMALKKKINTESRPKTIVKPKKTSKKVLKRNAN